MNYSHVLFQLFVILDSSPAVGTQERLFLDVGELMSLHDLERKAPVVALVARIQAQVLAVFTPKVERTLGPGLKKAQL